MSGIYFNEIDPFCAEWLRNLYPAATIDGRDIKEIDGSDLRGYTRVNLFAGIGGWELALKLAGWPEGRPVWTGSCPCQPFSIAGRRGQESDSRHLWPEFRRLIAECRPQSVFGEQVASPLGRKWLSGVRADLEVLGYAVGAADLCAAGVGAPHIRQRLYWVADSGESRVRDSRCSPDVRAPGTREISRPERQRLRHDARNGCDGISGRVVDADHPGPQRFSRSNTTNQGAAWETGKPITCADGKLRRVPSANPESRLFPLAHGVPQRVGRLRAYGNAIVPQVAATFIQAFLESTSAAASTNG